MAAASASASCVHCFGEVSCILMPPLTECGHGCGTSILCALCWFLQPRQIGKWLFAQLVPHCFCTAVVTAAVTAHWIEMLVLPPCAHGMNGSDDKHLFVSCISPLPFIPCAHGGGNNNSNQCVSCDSSCDGSCAEAMWHKLSKQPFDNLSWLQKPSHRAHMHVAW